MGLIKKYTNKMSVCIFQLLKTYKKIRLFNIEVYFILVQSDLLLDTKYLSLINVTSLTHTESMGGNLA